MSETVSFKIIVRLNIVKGLKSEILKSLLDSITSKYKNTMKNAFYLSDFAEYLAIENLTNDYKKELFFNKNKFDFITLEVDKEYYKTDKEYKMLKDFYQTPENTFKHKEIEMLAYSKVYDIERQNDEELEIEGFAKVFLKKDLQHLKPEYRIK